MQEYTVFKIFLSLAIESIINSWLRIPNASFFILRYIFNSINNMKPLNQFASLFPDGHSISKIFK